MENNESEKSSVETPQNPLRQSLAQHDQFHANSDAHYSMDVRPSVIGILSQPEFYQKEAVVPQQLTNADYHSRKCVVASALCIGFGSIVAGVFANLPFVLAPPTVVSIFLSVYLQQYNLGPTEGNVATVISGLILILFGWRPLGQFTARLIPISIQVGTAVGIGLLTALAGSTEIDLVVSGNYNVLKMGNPTFEICVAMGGVILICVAMRYHVKGSFAIAVILCSLVWWIYDNSFPRSIAVEPKLDPISVTGVNAEKVAVLTVDLIFLYVLYLNGLMTSLSNLAYLTREDSTIPRGRWIYIMCGGFSVLSGCISGAPILVSPESASSIKEGAKTGLSAVVAGFLFLLSSFFSPLFESVPAAGTSGILIVIGIILFQNVGRIDWRNLSNSAPAFIILFYIPFTYSIVQGVLMGYVVYLTIALCTGELLENTVELISVYIPSWEPWLKDMFSLHERMSIRRSKADSVSPLMNSADLATIDSLHHSIDLTNAVNMNQDANYNMNDRPSEMR